MTEKKTESFFNEVVLGSRQIILSNLEIIVDRYLARPDYRWIDMKFSPVDGKDHFNDPAHGSESIYIWIQGRALEALTFSAMYLKSHSDLEQTKPLLEKVEVVLRDLLDHICQVRKQNSGRLFFTMTPQGEPYKLDANGSREVFKITSKDPYNFSDLFTSKGIYSAASYLDDKDLIADARSYSLNIVDAIFNGPFASDQQQLDPNNPVSPVAGRYSHGPFMIQIGMAALMVELQRDPLGVELGLKVIQHILSRHVNIGSKWENLEDYDFVEFIDKDGNPYEDHGHVISDSGHALEFVGLALKFTDAVKKYDLADEKQSAQIEQIEGYMPDILKRNFENGFQAQIGGIAKLFDLISRTTVHKDMPWWSLPETLRAALECWKISKTQEQKTYCLNVAQKVYNAYCANYIKPETNFVAIQARGADGKVATSIPAVPDIDPLYHTGVSLIDTVKVIADAIW